MTTAPDESVALPTLRLMTVAAVAAVGVGAVWMVGAAATGNGADTALMGLAAGGVVAAATILALLIIRPWQARSIMTWPAIWLAGTYLRMVLALGGAFLLYSATPYRGKDFWFAAAVAYVAVMVGESRVYVSSMRSVRSVSRAAPAAEEPPGPE